VVIVAFYNLSMDKLSPKDQNTYSKANKYINERMPEFAQRFFKDKKNLLKPNSYYAYSIELANFFDHLKSTGLFNDPMMLSELSKVTPEIIENYVEKTKMITCKGVKRQISDKTEHRKICAISSFFNYYVKNDFIMLNPVTKINRPYIPNGAGKGSGFIQNLDVLDFVLNGKLPEKAGIYQDKLRNRDVAMIALMMSTGIKSSECVALDIDDIDLENNLITIKTRKVPNQVYISPVLAKILSNYLSERLTMIPVYGHDHALFLSLQMKRMSIRTLQQFMRKYTSLLFGQEHNITPRDLKNAFRFNSFQDTQNMYIAADINGMSSNTLYRYYLPYLEQFETKKGLSFSLENMHEGGEG